jgi:hypothetical protein
MIRSSTFRIARASLAAKTTTTTTRAFVASQTNVISNFNNNNNNNNNNNRCFSNTSTNTAEEKKLLFDVVPKEDFGQYKEYSVIFTNRSLNLMSDPFQKVMRDLNTLLKETYNARKVAIIPG